jgi:hypothetical protein
MRSTNSRSGASGSSDAVASTRQQRSLSPPTGIGDGNGHGESSTHRSRTAVIENSGPRRVGRRRNSIGSPSAHRTCTGVGFREPNLRLNAPT